MSFSTVDPSLQQRERDSKLFYLTSITKFDWRILQNLQVCSHVHAKYDLDKLLVGICYSRHYFIFSSNFGYCRTQNVSATQT